VSRRVYGVHPVEEAIKSARVHALFLSEERGPAHASLVKLAHERGLTPLYRPRAALDALVPGCQHQGAVALAGDYVYAELEQILHAAQPAERAPLVLVLDRIQDPQNLGALVRSAHVAGVDGVVIPRDHAAAVTHTVVKASAGATEHTRIARVTNVARTLEELKAAGLWVVGATAAGDAKPPWEVDLTVPVAIVLGAEGKGVRPLVLRGCDLRVQVPMIGRVASYNVSAAGAMLLYETLRQRAKSRLS
jgi:23S rRNA (guanosine2251-2'-O)-methyltransferase